MATSDEQAFERTVESHYVYRGRILDLRLDTVALPDGSTTKREIVEHRGAVAILPIDPEGNVILVRQFRKPIERSILEVPAGTLDPGEEVETCLHRELREETGLTADRVERLTAYYSAVGFCTEMIHVYAATGLHEGESGLEADEFVEVVPMPSGDALALVESGEIVDGKSIIALLSAKARGLI